MKVVPIFLRVEPVPVVLNDDLILVTKGMQCTTTRPVGSIIKLCGRDEMEKSFELDAIHTEKWLKQCLPLGNGTRSLDQNQDQDGSKVKTLEKTPETTSIERRN